jgi:hypothetical protein
MFYAVPRTNPSAPPSAFWPAFYEDETLGWKPIGCDPQSVKVWLGDTPPTTFGPIVGTPADWMNGLSFADFLAGRYVNPVPCIPLIYRVTWSSEQSFNCLVREGYYLDPIWSGEQSFDVAEAATAVENVTWSGEQSFDVAEGADVGQVATWSQQQGWYWVSEEEADYFALWSGEQSFDVAEAAGSVEVVSWSGEQSLSVTVVVSPMLTSFSCSTVVAAGSTQGTATAINDDSVSATSTGSGQGVILPAGCYRIVVRNANGLGGNSINVYPPSGASLGTLPTNTALSINAGQSVLCCEVTSTQWVQVLLT